MRNMSCVVLSGGLIKNSIYLQIQADVLGSEVTALACGEIDMMLAGTAIMARQAALRRSLVLEELRDVSFAALTMQTFKPTPEYKR